MEKHSLACVEARKRGEQGTDCPTCHIKFIRAMNKIARAKGRPQRSVGV